MKREKGPKIDYVINYKVFLREIIFYYAGKEKEENSKYEINKLQVKTNDIQTQGTNTDIR